MTSVRPTGGGPNMLRINGQEITTRPSGPIEGPRPAGSPTTDRPVAPPPGAPALQEEMYDAAHMASIRGQNASAALHGKKKTTARELGRKRPGAAKAEHKRIDGVFREDDPHQRQEQAFQTAAEFEEKVKDSDLSFSRKAAQVEVGDEVFQADIDGGKGALVAGTSSFEIDVNDFDIVDDAEADTNVGPMPNNGPPAVSVRAMANEAKDETRPNFQVDELPSSETGLRRALGLKSGPK